MSFGKLLAAGKSIINGRSAAAYREDKRVYLPKFVSPKNPFASSPQIELPKPEAENLAAPVKKITTSVWGKNQKTPAISVASKSRPAWTSKLNPISMWRAAPSAEQNVPPSVQTELSLDSIKVVLNDLSDAEVEVVPIKFRPVRAATEPISPSADGENSWSRLGAKFFGTNAV